MANTRQVTTNLSDRALLATVQPMPHLDQITLLVQDYDEAIAHFVDALGFTRDEARMKAAGATFCEEPRHENHGSVVVFDDISGNRWDLMQPKS